MPRRARTRRRTLDDLVAPPSVPDDECVSVPVGTGVAMRCQGDCPRCAGFEKEYADAAPERRQAAPAASTEALAGLVSRVDVKAPAWPAVRADLETALTSGDIDQADVRRDLAARLRALPVTTDRYLDLEEDL